MGNVRGWGRSHWPGSPLPHWTVQGDTRLHCCLHAESGTAGVPMVGQGPERLRALLLLLEYTVCKDMDCETGTQTFWVSVGLPFPWTVLSENKTFLVVVVVFLCLLVIPACTPLQSPAQGIWETERKPRELPRLRFSSAFLPGHHCCFF